MDRKIWRDDAYASMMSNPAFKGLVDMVAHALDGGVIDVEQARQVGLLAVNQYALRMGLRPFLLVGLPPGSSDQRPQSITVDGVVYTTAERPPRG